MSRQVSGSIPNLVNGVSQQAPALRLATQAEAQENFYSTVVEGLKDRPPTEFVTKLLDSLPEGVFTHIINRRADERYIVVINNADEQPLRVFDFEGNEKTVNAPNGWDYLEAPDSPEENLRALSVADYTFITNNTVKVAMKDDPVAPVRTPEALINVLAGNYAKTYRITVNGVEAAVFTTPDGSNAAHAAQVDTSYIATQLYNDLVAGGFNANGWHVARYTNSIHLSHDTDNFEIVSEDGFNNNAMKTVKDRTQRFADLLPFGPDGVVVEIIGDNTTAFDNYWVKLETDGSGPGIWREAVKPGTKLQIDGTTMPHNLVREADGTFTFRPAEWDERKCGDDEEISPDPSFVGAYIEDIYFHRNRLGFLTDENAVLSRNGSFFDFFRTTATALLDDDPIDTAASHVKVSFLKHAVPHQDELVLFSEQTQFTLSGNELLTPKTTSARPRTEYVCDPNVSPVGVGNSIFFASRRGKWSAIWEYTIRRNGPEVVAEADEVTSHVPAYIKAGVYKIIGTSNENMLAVLTTGDPSAIYVYKYFWSGEEKLQASWSRWSLPGSPTILNAEFVESDIYLVVKRENGVFLEKLRIQPNAEDDGMGFLVCLDQRVHSDDLAAPTYDAETNSTTYTLPYVPTSSFIAVTAPGGEADKAAVAVVESFDEVAQTITLSGDRTNDKFWFGVPYERRYRFSRIFLRTQTSGGGSTVVQEGRLQIKHLTLSYDSTAYFRVEVTPKGRQTYVYPFTGRILGDSDNVLGVVPTVAGKMSLPILSRNDRVTIEIVNDSWMPSAFISAEWTGTHSEKAKQL